jgi:hypothetical protein
MIMICSARWVYAGNVATILIWPVGVEGSPSRNIVRCGWEGEKHPQSSRIWKMVRFSHQISSCLIYWVHNTAARPSEWTWVYTHYVKNCLALLSKGTLRGMLHSMFGSGNYRCCYPPTDARGTGGTLQNFDANKV